MHAPVRSEIDVCSAARTRETHMGQAPLLLETGPALIVQCTLMREQPILPARKENGIEFETFGGVQRHDRDRLALALFGIHDQRDMLEEAREILKFLHGTDELLEVFQATSRIGAAVLLPHLGIT